MAMVGLKSFVLAFIVIIIFLFATGMVSVKPDGYACAGGWDTGFRDRVELVHFGPLRVYGYPFTRECDEQRRYDPNNVESCVDTGFCSVRMSQEDS